MQVSPLTVRLSAAFAMALLVALGAALAVGRWLIAHEMLQGLHSLHHAEFTELVDDLPPSAAGVSHAEMAARLREHAEGDADLFFFQVHDRDGRVLFRSRNLGETVLPDLSVHGTSTERILPPHGRLLVSEFNHGDFHIQIASRLGPLEQLLGNYARAGFVLWAGAAVFSLGAGYGLSRLLLRPVRAIAQTAQRIGADRLGERIPVPPGRDEITQLAGLLNETFDRLQRAFMQVRQFSADASHELKTPLTLIRLNAERLRQRAVERSGSTAELDELLEETAHMQEVVDRLLFLARAEGGALPLRREERDTAEWIRGVAEDAAVLAEDRGVRLELAVNEPLRQCFDPALLRQVVLNLVTNAIKVSPPGSVIMLRSSLADAAWRIELVDRGPGLTEAQIGRMFERFGLSQEQTPAESSGHGLGLAIARSLVQLHGGRISARRASTGGLHVGVELPAGSMKTN